MNLEFKSSNCYVRQAPTQTHEFTAAQFNSSYWQTEPGFEPISGGRGGSCRIEIDGHRAVLRRYHRGGFVGRLLSDQYLWLGKSLSRPWREWDVLQCAITAGLPVPEPIAACICRTGLVYRAGLIMACVEDTETLTQHLLREPLPADDWQRLGLLIKRMHAACIRHADLNSDNILIDSQHRFSLIDFDKARVINRLDDWQWQPLYRLQRSIEKRDQIQRLNYSEDDWQALMDGYQT